MAQASLEPEHFLGELEAAIMRVAWRSGDLTVRDVLEALEPTRPLAYTTVMTVMGRLAQKGILAVRREGKTYYYRAAMSPEAFVAARAQQAVQHVLDDFGDLAMAHFLRRLGDIDPARLAALRALAGQEPDDA